MLQLEAKAHLDHVNKLWDKWNPNELQLAEWLDTFRNLSDSATLKIAIKQHYRESRFNRPALSAILGIFHSRDTKKEGEADESGNGYAGFYVQCVEAPQGKEGRVGRCYPLYFGKESAIPENPDDVLKIAEKLRSNCQRLYGGRWVTMKDVREN